MSRHLRPEARPAKWNDLDATQQAAFRTVVKMIAESVENLPERPAQSDGLDWLNPNRTSQTVFLSGDRGTGKTTVMLSIAEMMIRRSLTEIRTPDTEFQTAWENLKQRVVWLETLDMEPLPASANLLTAILVRVEDSVHRLSGVSSSGEEPEMEAGLLSESSGSQRALLNLQRLQRKAMLSWDGNLDARRGHLDPETFSVEGSRGEHARLSLAAELEKVLHEVSSYCFNRDKLRSPLFLLPVDDIDLNPQACLHLLRLLRMISVPHLFTLVLGDQRVAELVLNLKLSSDLASIAGDVRNPGQLAVPPEEIGTMAGEIAANAMRKLLPPAQRVHLSEMELLEAVNFLPLGSTKDDRRLYQWMDFCPVELAEHILPCRKFGEVDRGFCSLRDVLLATGFVGSVEQPQTKPGSDKLTGEDLAHSAYNTGTGFLCVGPRKLTDLWLALRDVADVAAQPLRAARDFVHTFALKCRRSLIGDPALYPPEREAVLLGISRNPKGEWELGRVPVRIVFTTEVRHTPEVTLPMSTQSGDHRFTGEDTLRMAFAADRLHSFEARGSNLTGPPGSKPAPASQTLEALASPEARRRIKTEVAAELSVFHDLLAFRAPPGTFFSPLLPPELDGLPWASAEWQHGEVGIAHIAWPAPPLRTFWEYDFFLSGWNQKLARSWTSPYQAAIELSFAWLALGTAAMDRQPAVDFQQKTGIRPWDELGKRLEALAGRGPELDTHPELRDWLISVALLLMPESGLAWLPDLEGSLERVAGEASRKFWSRHRRLIIRLRAMRLADLVRQDMASLVEWLRLSPGLVRKPESPLAKFRTATAPTLALIRQLAGVAPVATLGTRRTATKRPTSTSTQPPPPTSAPAAVSAEKPVTAPEAAAKRVARKKK